MKRTVLLTAEATVKPARGLLAVLFFCALVLPAAAQSSAGDPHVQAAIDAAVAKDRKLYGGVSPVPGVLMGVWDGLGTSYVRAYGDADLATHRALTPEDHFRIGSNTKTFVITVLLQLVDEGKLSLDDPISKFSLGVRVPDAEHITVRQMCQMRSGLFETYDVPELKDMQVKPDAIFDARTLIGWAVKQPPYFAPGAGYHYSNTNYLLLGLIIESVTGHTVANEIRDRLLKPFSLDQTSYPDDQAMPDPWAHGYGLDAKGRWEDVSGTIPVSMMGAAGEMVSDMSDMARWVKLYVAGKTNGPRTQSARMTCLSIGKGDLNFGLGIGCSAGWFGYTGGLPGYNTAAYYFPERNMTMVVLVSLQADKPPPGVANAIVRDIAHVMTPNNVPFVDGNDAPEPH